MSEEERSRPQCRAMGCESERGIRIPFCAEHWGMMPRDLQAKLRKALGQPHQQFTPSAAYVESVVYECVLALLFAWRCRQARPEYRRGPYRDPPSLRPETFGGSGLGEG